MKRIVRDGLDQRLTWDAFDRLVRIEDFNAQQNPASFDYDGQGRRVGRDGGAYQYVVGPTGNQKPPNTLMCLRDAMGSVTIQIAYAGYTSRTITIDPHLHRSLRSWTNEVVAVFRAGSDR